MAGAGDKCRTNLIADTPTSEDAFGHARVATAIADLVLSEQGAKTIGLIGNWGSGKSSVVEILKQKLELRAPKDAKVFVFDAWAHQGDPLRRSYLEQLIDFAIANGWISDQSLWANTKAELSRRVQRTTTTSQPRLTPLGGVFAATILLLPMAFQLIPRFGSTSTKDFYLGIVGVAAIILPFLVAALTWVCWRPSLKVWSRDFWATHRGRYRGRSLLALFFNRTVEKTETNSIRTPDPTSVEFQSIFASLIKDVLRREERKLIVAVDNLDRIDVSDALAVWATLQTFFDFNGQRPGEFSRLWLLIPFDERGIQRLWASEDSGRKELVRSFTEKTFQITFRVSPPVLSDWHEFFKNQLKRAFPDHREDDFHLIYRIYDLKMLAGTHAPTPREMKLFINAIGAVHRQWKDEIALPIQALYVALQHENADLGNNLAFMSDHDILTTVPISMVGSDWRECVAAIHFNVLRNTALQVLVGGQLKDALLAGRPEKLEELTRIPGFTKLLEKQLETSCPSWVQSEAPSIAKVSATLSAVSSASDPSWERTWELLEQAAAKVTAWPGFSPEIASGIIKLIKRHQNPPLLKAIVSGVVNSVPQPKDAGASVEKAQLEPWANGCVALLEEIRTLDDHILTDEFSVKATGRSYINLMAFLAGNSKTHGVLKYFKPSGAPGGVIEALVPIVAEGKFDDLHRNATLVMLWTAAQWPLDGLIAAMKTRLQTSSNLPPAEVRSLLYVLLKLQKTLPAAKETLRFLAQSGFISHHLSLVQADASATALCVMAVMEYVAPGSTIQNSTTHSSNGTVAYNNFLKNPSSHAAIVKAFAQNSGVFPKLDDLYEIANRNQPSQEFIKAVLEEVLASPEGYKKVTPEMIVEQEKFLRDTLKPSTLQKLISDSVTNSELIAALIEHPFDVAKSRLYLAVLQAVPNTEKLMEFVADGLVTVSESAWSSELAREGELVELAIEVSTHGDGPRLSHFFEDALVAHAKSLLDGTAKISRLANNWPALLDALDTSFKRTAIRKLCDLLCNSTKPAETFLQVYGTRLSEEKVTLLKNKEKLVLYAFSSFVQRQNETELSWTIKVLESSPAIIEESDEETFENFQTRVLGALRQPASPAAKKSLETIIRLAGIENDEEPGQAAAAHE